MVGKWSELMSTGNTLSDFPDDFRIYACCGPCNRTEAVDRTKLPPTMLISELRARVRCRECGRRTNDIRIIYVGRAIFTYRKY